MAAYGHPYSPAELDLPGFVPQRLSRSEILAPFLGASLLASLAVWLISGRCGGRSPLSKADRLLMCWWAFTGLTHIVLEGPFLFTPDFFRKENTNYFDELFKEYSKGDSRYAARDTTILALEVITICLKGPASLLAVYAIASRKSYSHILQFAVSLVQLYGCLVYFVTAYTCLASTSGPVRSTSGHISSAQTVRGSSYQRSSLQGAGRRFARHSKLKR